MRSWRYAPCLFGAKEMGEGECTDCLFCRNMGGSKASLMGSSYKEGRNSQKMANDVSSAWFRTQCHD